MKLLLKFTFLFSFISLVHASSSIELGVPSYGGNGCPQGTSDVYISPDQSEIFIRFNNYITEAGNGSTAIARKSCNLAIPLHLAEGVSVTLMGIDYLGFVELPRKATATFNAEYFFVGESSVKSTKEFSGKISSDFHIKNDLSIGSQSSSACGADSILRVNTSMLVKTNKKGTKAVAIVDGMALDAGLVFKLKIKNCLK